MFNKCSMIFLGFRSVCVDFGYSSTMFRILSKKGMLAVLMISLVLETISFSGIAKAAPTLRWDQTSIPAPTLRWDQTDIYGRNIRLLASAIDGIVPVKWCLAVDGNPIKTDVSDNRNVDDQVFGTPFKASTGCWKARTRWIFAGAFHVPMSRLTAGSHLFTLTVSDAAGVSVSISKKMKAVHTAPTAQWDWKETNAGGATGKVTGEINYGFSAYDPVVSWCLRVDSKVIPYNLARTRNSDDEISDYTYDKLTGCWKSEERRSISSGAFFIPTQTLKNGSHDIKLKYLDQYGESGTLAAQFNSTNVPYVVDFWTEVGANPYPAKFSDLIVGATIGSEVSEFTIMAGYSQQEMEVVTSGQVDEFGQIQSNIGRYKSNSRVYVQVKFFALTGTVFTSVKIIAVPSPQPKPKPVPPTLPSSNWEILKKMLNPKIGGSTGQVKVVGQDCVKRKSPMSSSWQGQGYDWTIYNILANGARTIAKSGFGYEFATQGSVIPSSCHT